MNDDFAAVRSLLDQLRSQYAARCSVDVDDPATQITERDIVADIRHCLTAFCAANGYHVHCEIRPAPDANSEPDKLRRLPRIDVVVLWDRNDASWLAAAKRLQDKYTYDLLHIAIYAHNDKMNGVYSKWVVGAGLVPALGTHIGVPLPTHFEHTLINPNIQ